MINILEKSYLIIPEKVAQDNNLTPLAKILFAKIYSLTKQEGYCWATNKMLALYFNVTERTITSNINKLNKYGYIELKLDNIEFKNTKRIIYINYEKIE